MNATAASEGPARNPQPRVGLFVTCLVDLIRPSVGFAAVKLLEDAGCKVIVPSQTCCGQPAYNSGDRATAKTLARQAIDAFAGCDYVVAPSGSCAGMLAKHYPELFADEPDIAERAERLRRQSRTSSSSFLVDVLGVTKVAARFAGTVAYHDSCSGLRELGVKAQPRQLLAGVEGLSWSSSTKPRSAAASAACSRSNTAKSPTRSSPARADNIRGDRGRHLLAGDLGCLMNMAGKLQREGQPSRRATSPRCSPA